MTRQNDTEPHMFTYEAQSSNAWNYHVQFSVVSVDHKQQLRVDRSERCSWWFLVFNDWASYFTSFNVCGCILTKAIVSFVVVVLTVNWCQCPLVVTKSKLSYSEFCRHFWNSCGIESRFAWSVHWGTTRTMSVHVPINQPSRLFSWRPVYWCSSLVL